MFTSVFVDRPRLAIVIALVTTIAWLRPCAAAGQALAIAVAVGWLRIGLPLAPLMIGIAALSAWGLYRFNQHLASLPANTGGNSLAERLAAEAHRVREAYVLQYAEIFSITAIVCVVGALLGLLISAKHEQADEPEELQQRSSPRPIS